MRYRYINLQLNGSVALVTLKGDDASNRVNAQMSEDLGAACESIVDGGSVRVVVVMGEGSTFSGGTEEAVREMRERGGHLTFGFAKGAPLALGAGRLTQLVRVLASHARGHWGGACSFL